MITLSSRIGTPIHFQFLILFTTKAMQINTTTLNTQRDLSLKAVANYLQQFQSAARMTNFFNNKNGTKTLNQWLHLFFLPSLSNPFVFRLYKTKKRLCKRDV